MPYASVIRNKNRKNPFYYPNKVRNKSSKVAMGRIAMWYFLASNPFGLYFELICGLADSPSCGFANLTICGFAYLLIHLCACLPIGGFIGGFAYSPGGLTGERWFD